MFARRVSALAALALLSLSWGTARAGVTIGIGLPVFRPFHHHHHYCGPRVYVAPPPVYVAPAPVYAAPPPVYVQPAPAVPAAPPPQPLPAVAQPGR